MKVVELKKELKALGQDTNGLKKDLRNRLINAMVENTRGKELETIPVQNKLHSASDSVIVEEPEEEEKESAEGIDISKDSKEKHDIVEEIKAGETEQMNNDSTPRESERSESISSMQVEHHSDSMEQPEETKNDSFKKIVSSEQKKKKGQGNPMVVPKESFQKTEKSLTAIRETDIVASIGTSAKIVDGSIEKSKLTEAKIKQFSEMKKGYDVREDTGPPSEVSFSSKASGNSVKDMVSKFSGFSSSISSSSGSALSKSLQAKKEARQAKIAEMRAKVRFYFVYILCLSSTLIVC